MSDESSSKRRYELKKRAENVARTRARITEAAVDLHGSVGPARTTVSAVAERAGVQRHTVYRHFGTEEDLFAACSQEWLARNPLPDTDAWRDIGDPGERARTALAELYAYYERTEDMFANVYRDAPLVPALARRVADLSSYLDDAADALVGGLPAAGSRARLLVAAARHAVDFTSWRSLVRYAGVGIEEAVELMTTLIACAASVRPAP